MRELPMEVREAYEKEDTRFSEYEEYTEKQIKKRVEEAVKERVEEVEKVRKETERLKALEIAGRMLKGKLSMEEVSAATGLSLKDIRNIHKNDRGNS